MNKQNEMMNYVWLLNAAENSAFETKGLYEEFLKQEQGFRNVNGSLTANTPQCDYLEKEIKRNLESLEDLQKKIVEIIGVLKSPGGEPQ